ncbi:MAG: TRAP transporter small permease [Pseudomonadota bacterium]
MVKLIDGLVTLFKWIGAFAIAAMVFLTCADVVMRALGRPIWGAVEITGFLATIALACSLPYTHKVGGHVGVDLLIRRMPKRGQGGVDLVTSFLAMILFALVSWRSFIYALDIKRSGEVSMELEFPAYLFVYFIGFAFAILTLTILVDVVRNYGKAVGK